MELRLMLNRKHIYLLVLFLFPAVISCTAGITKTMNSWKGAHKSVLFMSWGPPTRVDPDGRGGEILTYVFDRNTGHKISKTLYGDDYVVKPTGWQARRMFWVNKKGIIYHWQARGL